MAESLRESQDQTICETCAGQGLVALIEHNAMVRCPDCRPEDFEEDCYELGIEVEDEDSL